MVQLGKSALCLANFKGTTIRTFLLFSSALIIVINCQLENDILKTYNAKNTYQCRRLCWYSKLCVRFSFYTINDNSAGMEDNCVLHVNNGQGEELMEGWMQEMVSADQLPEGGCLSRPCGNTEICIPVKGQVQFICARTSTADIDECAISPCQNGGNCVDQVNAYNCNCLTGYTGGNCETDTDECASSPCQNGGNCVDQVNAYTCNCSAGYTGINCQKDIDECASSPCQNGGSCVDQVNAYTCNCSAGYTGDHCETDTDECASIPCQNGGNCVDQVNAYTCNCSSGYSGDHCETEKWLGSACGKSCKPHLKAPEWTDCFDGLCLCSDGYFYSLTGGDCVPSCSTLLGDYVMYTGYIDAGAHDLVSLSNVDITDCQSTCNAEPDCHIISHRPAERSCQLKNATGSNHPLFWKTKSGSDSFQRVCQ